LVHLDQRSAPEAFPGDVEPTNIKGPEIAAEEPPLQHHQRFRGADVLV
jgi:hypothetical protein